MTDAFQLASDDRAVIVSEPDGPSHKFIRTPKGFTTAVFRNALAAYNSAYLAYGRLPSVEEVHQMWDRIPETTYAELLLTDEFAEALGYRGIDLAGNHGLTYEQSMTIDKLSNPLDKRSNEAKLKELGVSPVKLANWRKNPLFQKIMADRSEHNLNEHIPDILNRLVGKAEAGNIAAMDRVLAMSGRYDPQNRETVVLREFLQEFYRIIAQRIPDAEMREQIASDMTMAAGNIAMIEQQRKAIQ